MTSRKLFALIAAALLVSGLAVQASTIAPPAGATAVFSDDFEGYATTADMLAVWNGAASPAVTLAVGGGKGGGNGAVNSGGAVAQKNFAALGLSDAAPIVAEFDYWDYSTGGGDRNTVGLRNAGLTTLFEIGEYGSMDPNTEAEGDTLIQGYGFRTAFVGGPAQTTPASQGWVALTPLGGKITSTDPAIGYHHFKIEIGSSFCTASVQLSNGTVYSKTVSLTLTAGDTLDNIRMGGPSGNSSTGTAIVDNVQLYTTPEPASLLLIGLGGLLLRRRVAA